MLSSVRTWASYVGFQAELTEVGIVKQLEARCTTGIIRILEFTDYGKVALWRNTSAPF